MLDTIQLALYCINKQFYRHHIDPLEDMKLFIRNMLIQSVLGEIFNLLNYRIYLEQQPKIEY